MAGVADRGPDHGPVMVYVPDPGQDRYRRSALDGKGDRAGQGHHDRPGGCGPVEHRPDGQYPEREGRRGVVKHHIVGIEHLTEPIKGDRTTGKGRNTHDGQPSTPGTCVFRPISLVLIDPSELTGLRIHPDPPIPSRPGSAGAPYLVCCVGSVIVYDGGPGQYRPRQESRRWGHP